MKTEPKTSKAVSLTTKLPQVRRMRGDWEFLLLICFLFSFLYFITAQPLDKSDATSRNLAALTAALSNDSQPYVDRYISVPGGGFLTAPEDAAHLAYFNGHYFAGSAPGAAFLAVPFYRLGALFGNENAGVLLAVAMAGAACLLVFYGLARKIGAAKPSALYATLLLGSASALWREAGRFGPSVFSLLLFLLALLLALIPLPRDEQSEPLKLSLFRAAGLGILLGLANVVDLANLSWTPIFVAYLIWRKRADWQNGLTFGVSWIIGLLPLALYNWAAFGKPWTFAYGFLLNEPEQRSLAGQFLGGWRWNNLLELFFGSGRAMLGFFVLFFGVWGLVALYGQRGKRPETLFFGALMLATIVIALLRANESERIDFGITLLPPLVIGAAVWYERFLFLTRYEQRLLPWVALTGTAVYNLISPPRLLANLASATFLLPYGLAVLLIAVIWIFTPVLNNFQKGGLLIAVGLALTFWLGSPSVRPVFAESGMNNLLLNGGLSCEKTTIPGWYLNDQPLKCGKNSLTLAPGQKLTSYKVAVQGGKLYHLKISGDTLWGRLDWLWQDEGHNPVDVKGGNFTEITTMRLTATGSVALEAAAPPGAAYLQLILNAEIQPNVLRSFQLWDDGVRVEPMKNYARAALSFTFDWESAMGGLIHSKGGTPAQKSDEAEYGQAITPENIHLAVADAERRGLDMRRGADYLLEIFGRLNIRGTFYGNGYNLLDGNREKQTFAGDPVYKWAAPKNRWESDYWANNKWYGLDPYGDYKNNPAWYFGDQTDRLRAAGQDIQSHTFGHLYIRGVSKQEFVNDTDYFLRYAYEKDLPPIRHFAFPWTSSNSVTAELYKVLGDYGFVSVTRLYYTDQFIKQNDGALFFDNGKRTNQNTIDYEAFAGPYNTYYYLSKVPKDQRLYTYHDYYMTPGDKSESAAKGLIDELLRRRGYGSIWTHPESIVDASDQAQWLRVITYAAEKRAAGLWVDSIANIMQHRLDVAKIGVKTTWKDNGKRATLTVTNNAKNSVDGLTLTLPAPIKTATGVSSFKEAQLLLPTLKAGQTVTLEIEFS